MKPLATISAMLLFSPLWAQNLVPNGSFEEYTACPTYFGLASWSTGWQNLYAQSADYFNACHTNNVVGVPLNQFGYQYPADGDAYMGMVTYAYNRPEYREMVGTQLIQPLQIGVPVCLSFRAAVGGFGTSVGNSAGYTCKGIGMKFFNALPAEQDVYDYPNSAAIHLSQVPTDTAIWYLVEGTYIPDSAYTYVVVGNFFADSLNQPTIQDEVGINATDWAYAFVDDLRVSVDLNYCTLALSMNPKGRSQPLIYPTPAFDEVYIHLTGAGYGAASFDLRDLSGRSVNHGAIAPGDGDPSIELASLPTGVYLLDLTTPQGTWSPFRIVHVTP